MQARADRTRRLILKAAAELFEARGYMGASLQEVVAARGVSKGALYFHFPSKEQLASSIIRERQGLMAELAADLRDQHPRAMRLLLELSRRISDLLCDDVMTRAGARLACERDQIGAAAPMLLDDWTATVAEILSEARDQGDLLPGVDPQDAADFIVTSFTGLQRRGYSTKSKGDLHRRVRTMWRLLLPGLAAQACTAELLKELA